jgi:hypothetical protein
MEAKLIDAILIKNGNAYSLKINGEYVAFVNEDFIGYATQEFRDNLIGILSLKNCQAIERGYDLDELAKEYTKEADDIGTKYLGKVLGDNISTPFKAGFKKALSILGDKKFSEKDVKLAINIAWDDDNLSTLDIIQELQQNEWSVEIVEEDSIGIGDKYTPDTKPKLDAENCLILKRK